MNFQNRVIIMKIVLFGFFFVTSLSEKRELSHVDDEHYYVVHRNETWKNANSSCPLAKKDRTHEKRQYLIGDAIPQVWVGARVEYSPWLNITKCGMKYVNAEVRGISLDSSADALRKCSLNCFYNFALASDTCYCSDALNESYGYASKCKAIPCLQNAGFFCGENKRNKGSRCVCQYQPFVFNDSSKIGNCMTILFTESNTTKLQNEKCGNVYSPVCGNLTLTPMDWTDAGLHCFQSNEQFSGSRFFKTENSSSKFWIAAFRRSIIHWRSATTDDTPMRHCVAASRNDAGQWQMHIRQCEDKLPYLCYYGDKESSASRITKEIILTISTGAAGTILIILVAIIMYKNKYRLSKFCMYKRRRSFNIAVFHDKDPIMMYEEDPITPGIWTTGEHFSEIQNYHQVCFGMFEGMT